MFFGRLRAASQPPVHPLALGSRHKKHRPQRRWVMVKMTSLLLPEEVWSLAVAVLLVAAAGALGAIAPHAARRIQAGIPAPANDNQDIGPRRPMRVTAI
jgi:hypothetical protein